MSALPVMPTGPGDVPLAPSDIQMASPPTPQLPLRATTRPMAPNWRLLKMSDADMSTSSSWPLTAVVPLMAAPIRYGTTVIFHESPAGACADAGDAATTERQTTSAVTNVLRMNI